MLPRPISGNVPTGYCERAERIADELFRRLHFDDPQARSLWVGIIYEALAGDPQQDSI
jgi:hypothetical protein